jgi:hypothetical protein
LACSASYDGCRSSLAFGLSDLLRPRGPRDRLTETTAFVAPSGASDPSSAAPGFLSGKTIDFPVSKKSYSEFLWGVKLRIKITADEDLSPPLRFDDRASFFSSEKQ